MSSATRGLLCLCDQRRLGRRSVRSPELERQSCKDAQTRKIIPRVDAVGGNDLKFGRPKIDASHRTKRNVGCPAAAQTSGPVPGRRQRCAGPSAARAVVGRLELEVSDRAELPFANKIFGGPIDEQLIARGIADARRGKRRARSRGDIVCYGCIATSMTGGGRMDVVFEVRLQVPLLRQIGHGESRRKSPVIL